ncbi:MAG: hypothetical protein LBV43_09245 [Prevotella sp.]|jgi:hypothetical protein|nr:hypothetical protein [Prevotella sp.]
MMEDIVFWEILRSIWRYVLFPIFNYIGLPIRYLIFATIGKIKPISFLNRPKDEEPKDTWFNQRASNAAVGIGIVIVLLVIIFK